MQFNRTRNRSIARAFERQSGGRIWPLKGRYIVKACNVAEVNGVKKGDILIRDALQRHVTSPP